MSSDEFSDDHIVRYAEKASQADKESRHRRAVAKIVEPLLSGMAKTGTHRFNPEQFRALAQYLYEGEPKLISRAMKRGAFKISALEFVCDRTLGSGEKATISEFARTHGMLQQTLYARVCKSGIKSTTESGKKLYYVQDLTPLLQNASG